MILSENEGGNIFTSGSSYSNFQSAKAGFPLLFQSRYEKLQTFTIAQATSDFMAA